MALNCSLLGTAQTLSCTTPPLAGLESYIYLFNLAEKATVTSAADVISAITLAATKTGFKWEGGTDFIQGTYELRSSRVVNGFGHSIQITLPNDSQAALSEVKNMANGRIFAAVAKRGSAENTVRIYGINHGMEITEVSGDESNTENEGLPLITIATPDGYKEPLPPQHMLSTDFATTIAALDALM